MKETAVKCWYFQGIEERRRVHGTNQYAVTHACTFDWDKDDTEDEFDCGKGCPHYRIRRPYKRKKLIQVSAVDHPQAFQGRNDSPSVNWSTGSDSQFVSWLAASDCTPTVLLPPISPQELRQNSEMAARRREIERLEDRCFGPEMGEPLRAPPGSPLDLWEAPRLDLWGLRYQVRSYRDLVDIWRHYEGVFCSVNGNEDPD